ncbi:MAG: DUF2950 domain-containing protein [Xanthobacteraceae bacterium]|nr:DUF2950 domain-containing protein [Xanthobacteraceae bacterium]
MRTWVRVDHVVGRRTWPAWCVALAILLLVAMPTSAFSQRQFETPDATAKALVDAARANDVRRVGIILGIFGRNIISSGDDVADSNARAKFVAAYDAANRIVPDGDSKATLEVGKDNFPFPVPLVKDRDGWRFDTLAGQHEILARRIGANELNAIQVCLAYVEAQREYARLDPEKNGSPVYAQRVVSQPDKRDGLYWPAAEGAPTSPLGQFMAGATREGYRPGQSRIPYHGYYYKILRTQGPKAPGGAYDYVVKGKMIGGFALVAYPAEYRNSGVMTFVVNHDGAVFQKDLGAGTAGIASGMSSFNPDGTWKKVAP